MKVRKLSYRRHCVSCAHCNRMVIKLAASLVARGELTWSTPSVFIHTLDRFVDAPYLAAQKPLGVVTITDSSSRVYWGVMYPFATLVARTKWVASHTEIEAIHESGMNHPTLSFDQGLLAFDGWARARNLCLTESIQIED